VPQSYKAVTQHSNAPRSIPRTIGGRAVEFQPVETKARDHATKASVPGRGRRSACCPSARQPRVPSGRRITHRRRARRLRVTQWFRLDPIVTRWFIGGACSKSLPPMASPLRAPY